ncbi:hypothetical protein Tco_0765659 [Tanacetum coccineum]
MQRVVKQKNMRKVKRRTKDMMDETKKLMKLDLVMQDELMLLKRSLKVMEDPKGRVSRKSKKNGKSEEEKNKMLKKKSLMKSLIKILYDVKARIEADRILVRSFRAKKEMRLTIEGRAKFLHDTIVLSRIVPCLQDHKL